jgi:hypothetical protein
MCILGYIRYQDAGDDLDLNLGACTMKDIIVVTPPLWSSDSEFLATNPEVSGLIPGATRFSEK